MEEKINSNNIRPVERGSNKVRGELRELQQKMVSESKEKPQEAVIKAQEHLKRLSKRDYPTVGTVIARGTKEFKEVIGFINGHESDFPNNATLKEEDVTHIVLLKDNEGESAAIAMDAKYELIGFAD